MKSSLLYLGGKLLYYGSVFSGIIVFAFYLFHIAPSDPARIVLGPNATQEQVEQLRKKLGLDQSLEKQLINYFKSLARGDVGRSFVDDRNVFKEVKEKFLVSLFLIALCMVFVSLYLIVTVLAFDFSLLRKFLDSVDFVISSLPIFFSGVIFAILTLYFYPFKNYSGNLLSWNNLGYLIPPALVLGFYPMAILAGILKKEMTSVSKTLFMLNQEALSIQKKTILSFPIRNALIPILSALSNILPVLLTGAFVVEIIFSIPGTGTLLIKSILQRDFPMIEGVIIINGLFFAIINLVSESLYPLIDPRLRKQKQL